MPQMMPINWILLFLFFLMIFFMFNIMNYYIFKMPIKNYKSPSNKSLLMKNFNWKW